MEIDEIKKGVDLAFKAFQEKDFNLIEVDASERSITHTIALRLSEVGCFKNWDIDCEYNRNLTNPKKIIENDITFKDLFNCNKRVFDSIKNMLNKNNNWEEIFSEIMLFRSANKMEILNVLKKYKLSDDGVKIYNKLNKLFTRNVYPDIIIHKRNSKDNLLIIEVKKCNQDDSFDKVKMKYYLTELNYKLGLILNLPRDKNDIRIDNDRVFDWKTKKDYK